jgi:hypothetical protein
MPTATSARTATIDLAFAEPFASAEEAWYWTISALDARAEGALIFQGGGAVVRPCEPGDVVKRVDGLFRRGRLSREHVEVLARWGRRSHAPDVRVRSEERDAMLWAEALDLLEAELARAGIVSCG